MKITCVVCNETYSMSQKELEDRGHYCAECNAKCGKPNVTYLRQKAERRKHKEELDRLYIELYGKNEEELLVEAWHYLRMYNLGEITLSDQKTTTNNLKEVV